MSNKRAELVLLDASGCSLSAKGSEFKYLHLEKDESSILRNLNIRDVETGSVLGRYCSVIRGPVTTGEVNVGLQQDV